MSHSPGPWHFDGTDISDVNGDNVTDQCGCGGVTSPPGLGYSESEAVRAANGALLADAPTMLELLRGLASIGPYQTSTSPCRWCLANTHTPECPYTRAQELVKRHG